MRYFQIMGESNRTSKLCNYHELSPYQSFVSILAVLGISVFLALIFMLVIFVNEQLGITPFLGIFYIDHLSEGENWILFMGSIIFAFFIGVLTIWVIFRHYRRIYCNDINVSIEQYPNNL